jgi:FlgD Ig-like domain/The GLUG motif
LFLVLMSSTITALSQSYSGGSGISTDPYLISTKADLKYLSENTGEWGKYFKQTVDIIFSDADFQSGGDFYNGGSGFIPIGNGAYGGGVFTGGYDGNGHKISNLKINRGSSDNVSLFGFVNTGGVIKNLGVENVNITGRMEVGGLVGTAQNATISNCYTTGSLSSLNNTGGIVGYDPSCTISNCYSSCSAYGKNDVGGLVGYNAGTISNCYSTGTPSGGSSTGGFAGINWGSISNCFWDTQTSGTNTGIDPSNSRTTSGVTGETTAAMKTTTIFQNAGWDYSIWYMDSGVNNGYPYFSWQNPSGTPLPVELSSFTASVNLGTVTLKWQTATEVNNLGFDIERSSANNNFNKIGYVAGSSNSNSPKNYSFTDQPTGGTSFSYRLRQIDNDGNFKYYDAITLSLAFSTKAELMDNYPNPFNPSTAIKFYIPSLSDVTIKIYDILGKEVSTLLSKQTESGFHIVYWNGKDKFGNSAASGTYIYKIEAGNFIQSKKMILLK